MSNGIKAKLVLLYNLLELRSFMYVCVSITKSCLKKIFLKLNVRILLNVNKIKPTIKESIETKT